MCKFVCICSKALVTWFCRGRLASEGLCICETSPSMPALAQERSRFISSPLTPRPCLPSVLGARRRLRREHGRQSPSFEWASRARVIDGFLGSEREREREIRNQSPVVCTRRPALPEAWEERRCQLWPLGRGHQPDGRTGPAKGCRAGLSSIRSDGSASWQRHEF